MRLNPATGPGVSIPGLVKVSDRIVHIIVSTHHKFSFSLNITFRTDFTCKPDLLDLYEQEKPKWNPASSHTAFRFLP
jgi:hypothetical protein